MIGGDLNYPGWDWKNQQLKPNTPNTNLHEDFMKFLNTYGLTQHVTEPTRLENTLDLIFSNIPERINGSKSFLV